ncbi:hypothetical protein KI387_034958, partial [Taxus chinensis]
GSNFHKIRIGSPLEQQFEEFSLTRFKLEQEVIQGKDGLQISEEGEVAPNPKEEEHLTSAEENIQ